jgi:hypothetical protein
MVDAPAKPRFWDNLIPLRGSLFGEQLGGWTPGPPVISGLGCTMLSDQPIPVADNVSLAADIYLPQRPRRARPDAAAARREIAVRRRQPHRSAAERCQPRPRAFRLPVPPYLSRNTLHYGAETYLELQRIGS